MRISKKEFEKLKKRLANTRDISDQVSSTTLEYLNKISIEKRGKPIKTRNDSELELLFEWHLAHTSPALPPYEREYKFHPNRRWRFDYAWPALKIAVEIDGGQWTKFGGRHARDSDREKHNNAILLGWRVLRFSDTMLKNDPEHCITMLRGLLAL